MKLFSFLLATVLFAPAVSTANTGTMTATKDALLTDDIDSSCFIATEPRYLESLQGVYEVLVLSKFPALPDGTCDFSQLRLSLIRHIPEGERDYSKEYVATTETTGVFIDIGTDGTVETYYPGDAGPEEEPVGLYLSVLAELFAGK